MNFQRVGIITIGARDISRLRSFYKSLGWTETEISTENYSVFNMAGVFLALFPMDELINDAGLPSQIVEHAGFNRAVFTIPVERSEDVDHILNEVRIKNGTIIREPEAAFWGGRMGYFMDPEENVWEVAWIPTAKFENGIMTSY